MAKHFYKAGVVVKRNTCTFKYFLFFQITEKCLMMRKVAGPTSPTKVAGPTSPPIQSKIVM